MADKPLVGIEEVTGLDRQLSPEDLQIVDGEAQTRTQSPMPLIHVAEPDKRTVPGAAGLYAPGAEIVSVAGTPATPGAPAPVLVGFPIVRWTRYVSAEQEWRELISWVVPFGYVGDLHEISLVSDNDAKTRYRITIAEMDMQIPTDRTLATPVDFKWRDSLLPGPATIMVEVRSTDGTSITVDAELTGTFRNPPA